MEIETSRHGIVVFAFFYLHERELLRLHRNLFLYKTYSSFCRHLKRASISYGVLGRDDSLDHPPM